MADALASGASVRKDVGVQVPPRAPTDFAHITQNRDLNSVPVAVQEFSGCLVFLFSELANRF